MCTYTYTHIKLYIYIHIHTHTHIDTSIHLSLSLYTYIYIYIYVLTGLADRGLRHGRGGGLDHREDRKAVRPFMYLYICIYIIY